MSLDTDITVIDSQIDWDQVRLKYNPQRPCKLCGTPLDSNQSNRVTCSDACRQAIYRIRLKARKQLQATNLAIPATTPTTDIILGE